MPFAKFEAILPRYSTIVFPRSFQPTFTIEREQLNYGTSQKARG